MSFNADGYKSAFKVPLNHPKEAETQQQNDDDDWRSIPGIRPIKIARLENSPTSSSSLEGNSRLNKNNEKIKEEITIVEEKGDEIYKDNQETRWSTTTTDSNTDSCSQSEDNYFIRPQINIQYTYDQLKRELHAVQTPLGWIREEFVRRNRRYLTYSCRELDGQIGLWGHEYVKIKCSRELIIAENMWIQINIRDMSYSPAWFGLQRWIDSPQSLNIVLKQLTKIDPFVRDERQTLF